MLNGELNLTKQSFQDVSVFFYHILAIFLGYSELIGNTYVPLTCGPHCLNDDDMPEGNPQRD